MVCYILLALVTIDALYCLVISCIVKNALKTKTAQITKLLFTFLILHIAVLISGFGTWFLYELYEYWFGYRCSASEMSGMDHIDYYNWLVLMLVGSGAALVQIVLLTVLGLCCPCLIKGVLFYLTVKEYHDYAVWGLSFFGIDPYEQIEERDL